MNELLGAGDLITWESLGGNDIPLSKRFGVVVVLGQNGTIAPPDALWCIWTLTPEEAVEKYKSYKEKNIVPTRLSYIAERHGVRITLLKKNVLVSDEKKNDRFESIIADTTGGV